jgi:primary-amine oxidase
MSDVQRSRPLPRTRRSGVSIAIVAGLLACAAVLPAIADDIPAPTDVRHPLDALTAAEIEATVAILRAAGHAPEGSDLPVLTLREPPKADVLAWRPGQPFTREADVVVAGPAGVFEAIVDLRAARVRSWTARPGVQPRLTSTDFVAADAAKREPAMVAALQKRGYAAPFDNVLCAPLAAGPLPPERGGYVRVANVSCYDIGTPGANPFGSPIEGLMAVVDLRAGRVVRTVDLGVVPLTDDGGSLLHERSARYRAPALPIAITTPGGSNIRVEGSQLQWDNWRLHLRVDTREGLIASDIRYDDRGTARSVAYQVSPSEMYVPYMDPDETWSFKAYMDIGEYGFGEFLTTLAPRVDCPEFARFLSATLPNEKGRPVERRNVVCIFERPTGDPLWRHGSEDGRANIELVVRIAPVVGNYDYLIDYVFDRAGNLDVRAGALGIDAAKGVATRHLGDATAARDTAYGTLIGRGLVGINHDHYISFRIDLDVDGPDNRAVFDQVRPRRLPGSGTRRSLWQVVTKPITRAGPLRDPPASGSLRIESASRRNALGYPTSYQLYPGHTESSLLSDDDPVQARAAWSRYPVWLSRHDPSQRHASGAYPNQDTSGDGLAAWTKAGQDIADRDLVLWYNIGFRHVPRAEDWPAMPAVWHGFRLRPFNFFDRSPAMDVPPDGGASR